jgi:glycosyltransferase involved in cell wall biosynthesis
MTLDENRPRVLAMGYALPPDAHAEAFVSAKALAGLADHADIDVITAEPALLGGYYDTSLGHYLDRHVGRLERISGLAARLTKNWRRLPLPPDRCILLTQAAVRAAMALDVGGYDCLLTRSQFHSVHIAGLVLKRRFPRLPWVASFSDPWMEDPYRRHLPILSSINARLERAVFCAADVLVFCSSETVDLALAKYPASWREKVVVIPHCYDPDLYGDRRPHPGQPLTVRHIGAFYKHRTPLPLFKAFQQLFAQGRLDPATVRLELIGIVEGDVLDGEVCRSLPPGFLTVRQPVPYRESLDLMQSADLLVFVDAPADRSVFLPSKLIDYMGAGRPVFGVTPPGAAAEVLTALGGHCADPRCPEQIADNLAEVLGELAAARDADATRPWGDPDTRARFHRSALGGQLAQAIERAIGVCGA